MCMKIGKHEILDKHFVQHFLWKCVSINELCQWRLPILFILFESCETFPISTGALIGAIKDSKTTLNPCRIDLSCHVSIISHTVPWLALRHVFFQITSFYNIVCNFHIRYTILITSIQILIFHDKVMNVFFMFLLNK